MPFSYQPSTLAYTYDELGRALSAKVNGTGNNVTYDALGGTAPAVNPLGTFMYYYVGQTGRLDYVDRPGGQKVDYGYLGNAGDNRLAEIKNLGPAAAALSKFNSTYDAVGNIRTWTQQVGMGGSQYYDLGYNRADELMTAPLRDAATGAMVKPYTYRYDAAGNRTSEQVDNSVTTAGYNNLNQMKTIAAGGTMTLEGDTGSEAAAVTVSGSPVAEDVNNRFKVTVTVTSGANAIPIVATDGSGITTSKTAQITISGSSSTLTYDFNGNLTGDGAKTYEWDVANRLLAINYVGGSNRTEFAYDALNRRTQIVEKTGSTINSTKKFVWIGNSPVEERDGGNTVTKRFFGEGEQIGGTAYLFTKDHLGSVREMVDTSGVAQARYAYDPYGRRTKLSGSLEADFGFTGHYYHATSGLHLALYRAYDANKGRWLSRDPIGEGADLILYRYVWNSPLKFIDRTGLIGEGLTPIPIPGSDCAGALGSALIQLTVGNKGLLPKSYPGIDGREDKYNHCLRSCKIAKACGDGISSAVGFAKEVLDEVQAELNIQEGGADWKICMPTYWEGKQPIAPSHVKKVVKNNMMAFQRKYYLSVFIAITSVVQVVVWRGSSLNQNLFSIFLLALIIIILISLALKFEFKTVTFLLVSIWVIFMLMLMVQPT